MKMEGSKQDFSWSDRGDLMVGNRVIIGFSKDINLYPIWGDLRRARPEMGVMSDGCMFYEVYSHGKVFRDEKKYKGIYYSQNLKLNRIKFESKLRKESNPWYFLYKRILPLLIKYQGGESVYKYKPKNNIESGLRVLLDEAYEMLYRGTNSRTMIDKVISYTDSSKEYLESCIIGGDHWGITKEELRIQHQNIVDLRSEADVILNELIQLEKE